MGFSPQIVFRAGQSLSENPTPEEMPLHSFSQSPTMARLLAAVLLINTNVVDQILTRERG